MNPTLIIIIVMLFSGILGGLTLYWTGEEGKNLYSVILQSTIAAFMVPLFLNTLSSDLMTKIHADVNNLLIFAGFTLLASLTPKVFINALSDRFVKDIKQQQKDSSSQIKEVQSLVKTIALKSNTLNQSVGDILIDHTLNHGLSIQSLLGVNKFIGSIEGVSPAELEDRILFYLGAVQSPFIEHDHLIKSLEAPHQTSKQAIEKLQEENLIITMTVGEKHVIGISDVGFSQYVQLVNTETWRIHTVAPDPKNPSIIVLHVLSSRFAHTLEYINADEINPFSEGIKLQVQTRNGVQFSTDGYTILTSHTD